MTEYKIAIVAGEQSGDILGAGIIRALNNISANNNNIKFSFFGIGGSRMQQAGFNSIFSIEEISVMGLFEPLKRLPKILSIRKNLIRQIINHKADLYIGIDSPEFNLSIEKVIKANNIPTIHCVSPQLWAWRPKRIYKIAKAVSYMFLILPFEQDIYKTHNIPNRYIGYPIANQIDFRDKINKPIDLNNLKIAILPGSRNSEVNYLAEDFFKTALNLRNYFSNIEFVVPAATNTIKANLLKLAQKYQEEFNLNIIITDTNSREILDNSDYAIIASGTSCMEAMLLQTPFIVAYKVSKISEIIARLLIKVKYISLPNILANEKIVPEFLQKEVDPQKMAEYIANQIKKPEAIQKLRAKFLSLHKLLKQDSFNIAANDIIYILQNKNKGNLHVSPATKDHCRTG